MPYLKSSLSPKTNRIVGMIAPKGRGKTTLALALLHHLPRAAVFDFNAEDGYAVACEDMAVGSPYDLWAAMHSEQFSVCYRPREYDPKTQDCPGFNQFCSIGFRRGRLWLVIDEAHLFCRPHNIPPELLRATVTGRHTETSILYITQSFTIVERTLRANTNTFVFFRITDPTDLDGVRQRCGREVEQRVQNLRILDARAGKAGEVLLWCDTGESIQLDMNLPSDLEYGTKVLLTGSISRATMAEEKDNDERGTPDDPGERAELRHDLEGDSGNSPRQFDKSSPEASPARIENQEIPSPQL
jgi:hypothetical protein